MPFVPCLFGRAGPAILFYFPEITLSSLNPLPAKEA
jgi:hypothetical protein